LKVETRELTRLRRIISKRLGPERRRELRENLWACGRQRKGITGIPAYPVRALELEKVGNGRKQLGIPANRSQQTPNRIANVLISLFN
jgi:hypothetical protein